MKKGFTLIEILIALAILSLIFSLIIPFSYSIYIHYKEAHEIEKVVLFLSTVRRESFLYNQENTIYEKNGILHINNKPMENISLRFRIDKPIIFFKNGTSSGGLINVFAEKNSYRIEISSPFGEIHYEKS